MIRTIDSKYNIKYTCIVADSFLNSLTTYANASGLTPFSTRLIRMDRVYLSRPQFNI